MSRASLIRAWNDPRPLPEIAAEFGISMQALSNKAHRAGLPDRKSGPKKVGVGGAEFARLWLDGVRTRDLVTLYGCDHLAPARHARRLGLPKRGKGWRFKMTLDEWKNRQIAARMDVVAAAERTQMRMAEMVDRIGGRYA